MGANVVDLSEYRKRREHNEDGTEGWVSGPAHCLQCDYTWVAVAPVGLRWLQCPDCKSEKGHFEGKVNRGELDWVCKCGNDLFRICEDGAYCTVCGTLVDGVHFD